MIARHDSAIPAGHAPGTAHIAGERGSAVLVALRNAREEIVAGCGTTLLAVRTLDGLSCDLHEGELLLLTGGVASGARALLRAFLGNSARLHVGRRVAHGVQIRRGAISETAMHEILAGWHDPSPTHDASTSASSRRAVYLLRVRRHPQTVGVAPNPSDSQRANADASASWRHWAAALRFGGGAIALACEGAMSLRDTAMQQRRATAEGDAPPDVVRESMIDRRTYEPLDREPRERSTRTGVRVLALAAGRIVRESAGSPASTDENAAARLPTACCRSSTGLPAP